MCGRTCLTLEPNEVQCACKYNKSPTTAEKDEEKKLKTPEWRSEYNFGKKYEPNNNITPSSITPVLVSTKHFDKNDENQSRVIVPMMWGMIPFWHKGDYRKHGLTTNNCRLEHMLDSKLYGRPFRKGQRCVVVCEGFYEWQTTKSAKPSERSVYFIHVPQKDEIKIHDASTWKKNPENLKLLKMAGLFDIWTNENGDKIFSYTVITFEATDTLSWLHHRMPAILETEEQVSDWLDFDKVPDEKALSVLKCPVKLSWYRVSNSVNNSRNKSEMCNKPLNEVNDSKKECPIKSKIMKSWLIIRKRKENDLKNKFKDSDDDDDEEDYDGPKGKYLKMHRDSSELDSSSTPDTESESNKNLVEIKKET